jgi:NO-binding membrane sensor protein with MHYT domain
MFIRVLDCISADHDSALVVVALAVAFCSGFTLFSIMDHIRTRSGRSKSAWTLAAAFVAGGGIWSTHFIAMLGFNAPMVVTYDVGLTVISAAFAIAFAAMAVLLLLSTSSSVLLGGMFLCAAIGTMHFLGMKALLLAGSLEWKPELVALSLCVGGLLAVLAASIDRRRASLGYRLAAGTVFGLAICALHFTAMSAAVFRTDPTVQVADGSLSGFVLGISVALVTSSIAICSLVVVVFDRRAHSSARLAGQLRGILETARTGILVCEDGEIVAANRAFGLMVGHGDTDIAKRPLTDFVQLPSSTRPELHSHESKLN